VAFWQDDDDPDLIPLYWSENHYNLHVLGDTELRGFLDESNHETYEKRCQFVAKTISQFIVKMSFTQNIRITANVVSVGFMYAHVSLSFLSV
jgi:hypothetical protein